MAITFRLPTFHLDIHPYIVSPGPAYEEGDLFAGQLYTFARTADDVGVNEMYLVYPKEVTVLRDFRSLPGGLRDAVLIDCGDQGSRWYWVDQVEPRWAGFGNRHWIAVLSAMTDTEAAAVVAGGGPVEPEVIYFEVVGVENGTCESCSQVNNNWTMYWEGPGVWTSVAFETTCYGPLISRLERDGDDFVVGLSVSSPYFALCRYEGSYPDWDGVSPIPVSLVGGGVGDCLFPDDLVVRVTF